MTFQVHALPAEPFRHLYGQSDAALRSAGVLTQVADAPGAFPCRVSLSDVEAGARLLLLNFEHQPVSTPYRSRHAIFVADGAEAAAPKAGEVPPVLAKRLLSVRSFDAEGLMIDADVVDGSGAPALFDRLLAAGGVTYLHVHSARRGCYLAAVTPTGKSLTGWRNPPADGGPAASIDPSWNI